MFFNCYELVRHVERYLDIGDLQRLGATNRHLGEWVRDYVKRRISRVSAQYFAHADDLLDIIRCCDTVISGSTALHLLLPEYGTPWTPSDLDIYVPQRNTDMLLKLVTRQGYEVIVEPPVRRVGYTYTHVNRVVILSNGRQCVDVIVSRTRTALSPIFQFHSTVVMNFISGDTMFSSYLALTLRHLSLVNAGPLYYDAEKHAMIRTIRKYVSRGFRYIHCEEQHGLTRSCKVTTRTVTDHAMLWFNFHAIPCLSHNFQEVMRGFGVLDLQWMLGGMPCGLESAFARPRVDVVEDQS
ncbi:hypothetical protein EDD15DRAFT_2165720 [Pisolithus albus]|nr:hypothetical protein EDD15DRAFT_2165720 [Pisolithus albus]